VATGKVTIVRGLLGVHLDREGNIVHTVHTVRTGSHEHKGKAFFALKVSEHFRRECHRRVRLYTMGLLMAPGTETLVQRIFPDPLAHANER
jgi:hypothetical protein